MLFLSVCVLSLERIYLLGDTIALCCMSFVWLSCVTCKAICLVYCNGCTVNGFMKRNFAGFMYTNISSQFVFV